MNNIDFKCKECGLSNSEQCTHKYTEGYIATCVGCNSENVICRFSGCNLVIGPSAAASAKKRPWTYFLSNHYRRFHERNYNWRKRKADNDLQSQGHRAISVRESTDDNNNAMEEEIQSENQSKECPHIEVQVITEESNKSMEYEMSDDINFDCDNDIDNKIGCDDSLESTGQQQFDGEQANFFIVETPEEIVVETPEEISTTNFAVGVSDTDDGIVDSDETSKCWSIADDGVMLDQTFVQASIDGLDMSDNDVDDTHHCFLTEYVCADIDPEDVDEYNESSETDGETNSDSIITAMMDETYSKMRNIFDRRSDEQRMIRKGSSIVSLSQITLYFAQKHCMLLIDCNDHFGGYRGLVHRCRVRKRNEKHKIADKAESMAVFMYHMLVLNLTESEQELLIRYEKEKLELLGMTEELLQSATKFQFPKTYADIRRSISDGAYSIMKNFPSQRVFSIAGHACVSLRETFCIMAGHYGGFVFAWDGRAPEGEERNIDGPNGCKGVRNVCRELMNTLLANGRTREQIRRMQLGWITLWSDSFLNSFIKQKDNSVWLLTATVSPPYDQTNSGNYTFVLAMGKSSLDHTEVINYYLSEIKEMEKGFMYYNVDKNDFGECALGLLAYVADRPEKSAVRGTRQEGHFGKVTDWAVSISTKYFPACKQCYICIVKESLGMVKLSRNSQCNKCCCWKLDENHNPEFYHKTTSKYPWKRIPDRKVPKGRPPGVRHIGPKRMSSKWLIAACHYAYDARRTGLWTKANIEEYLRTCNIRDDVIQEIDRVAENDRKRKRISDIEDYVPTIWMQNENLFANCMCFDAPMHAFCHGMVVDTMNAKHQVLAKWRLLTNYIEITNVMLSTIASFNLEWLKIKKLPKAAWIGENTMAYMRLMSYCYGSYFLNHKFKKDDELTLLSMKRMVNSLQSVASMMMSSGTLDGEELELGFKLLLSNAQRLQQEFGRFEGTETTSSSRKKVVDQFDPVQLGILLLALGQSVSKTDTVSTMKSKLEKIPVNHLKQALEERGITATRMSKEILQQTLFYAIVTKQTLDTGKNDNAATTPQSQNTGENAATAPQAQNTGEKDNTDEDECFWAKGNWLSEVTNVKAMVEMYNSIRDLW